jgi:hypothetical protein
MIHKCPTCGRDQKRSSEANKRYWLLLEMISQRIKSENKYYTKKSWHIYFCSIYLGCHETELPHGLIDIERNRSSELSTSEFAEFLDQVQAWAAERGVYLDS